MCGLFWCIPHVLYIMDFYLVYSLSCYIYSTHGDIKLANPCNNQLMRTFKYNGAKLWNALAISVREKASLNSFKCAYFKDLFTLRQIFNGFIRFLK